MYLEDDFKEHVMGKLDLEDYSVLENKTILQMIYALEWYNIPKNQHTELIFSHPYLTEEDAETLNYIEVHHTIENAVCMALSTIISNRLLYKKGPSYLKMRATRFPVALMLGASITSVAYQFLTYKMMVSDLEEAELNKYYELDLNADMMRQDLAKVGIHIDAKYFDLASA